MREEKIMEERFERIEISKISPSPHNRRENFSGPAFDELTASIAQKGVLEPVLVRPVNGTGTYELVAGERRWRASLAANLPDIPAVIRDMDENAAMECTIIENLQREDLSEIEEARSFKDYLDSRLSLDSGEPVIPAKAGIHIEELSKAIGKSTTYIRRRVKVLDLPADVLKLWEAGTLIYSHLEQLIRLDNGKNASEIAHKFLASYGAGAGASKLADMINWNSPKLADALFSTEICDDCPKNTEAQTMLFGMAKPVQGALCLDPGYFKHHQNDWLLAHWPETDAAKKYGTNGFLFSDNKQYHQIYVSRGKEACKACLNYVSIVGLDGKPTYPQIVCKKSEIGCYEKTYPGPGTSMPAMAQDLGPEFRRTYYRDGLIKAIEAAPHDDERILRIMLNVITDEYKTRQAFMKEAFDRNDDADRFDGLWTVKWRAIETLKGDALRDALHRALLIRMRDEGFLSGVLDHVATHFGVNLKNWTITTSYLSRKDAKQLVKLGKELAIFDDPKVQKYIDKQLTKSQARWPSGKPEKMDKKQLIECFMKSGLDLTGLVPKEIIGE
jgi:ParB/RepB/Spo0J family partition protein